jgi:hypothetical protein
MGKVIVKFTHAIARVLKRVKIRTGRGQLLEQELPLHLSPHFLL